MLNFEINLIGKSVLPAKKRKLVFLALMANLLFCLVIFLCLALNITADFSKISGYQNDIFYIERKNSKYGLDAKKTFGSARDARAQLVQYIERLQTIDDILSRRINIMQLFASFSKPLSSGAYIDNFYLDSASQALNFNVHIPLNKGERLFNASELASAWKKDPFITSYIENIKSSATQKREYDKKSEVILLFSCSLLRKDS